MKTSELTGAALDWAVAKALGFNPDITPGAQRFARLSDADKNDTEYANLILNAKPRITWDNPVRGVSCPTFSTDWAQGGPIIERERIDITFMDGDEVDAWHVSGAHGRDQLPLIAAMRCYVTSKLGDEVDVPNELTKGETA